METQEEISGIVSQMSAISEVKENKAFRQFLLKVAIPTFHRVYAKFGNPQSLELAREAGEMYAKLRI